MFGIKTLFMILSLGLLFAKDEKRKFRIGIIGAGIGGTHTAYRLLNFFSDIQVDLLDKASHEGGRMETEYIGDLVLDMGGSCYLVDQEFISNLVDELGIPTKKPEEKNISILSEDGRVVNIDESNWLNTMKMLWRYGLSPTNMRKVIDIHSGHIKKIYKYINNQNYFQNVGEFLKYIGCSDLINKNLEEYLTPVLNRLYIEEIINSNILSMFLQNSKDINAFTGLQALENSNRPYRVIEGGAVKIVQKMLKRLELNNNFKFIKNQIVNKISKTKNNTYVLSTSEGEEGEYDIVIIASPLTVDNYIKFDERIILKDKSRLFFRPISSEVLYIKGKLKPYLLVSNKTPKSIIKTHISDGITNIDYIKDDVYKIRGKTGIANSLNNIFDHYEIIKDKIWSFNSPLFKVYANTEELPDIILDHNLFYLNALESVYDGMESALLSSYNIFNMIKSNLKNEPTLHKEEF